MSRDVTYVTLKADVSEFRDAIGRMVERMGHPRFPIIADETHYWPLMPLTTSVAPTVRRASGRITWARPVGTML